MPSRHALQRKDAARMSRQDEEEYESGQAEIDRGVDEEAGERWRNRGCVTKGQDQDEIVGSVNRDHRPDGVHSQAGRREQDADQRRLEHLIRDTKLIGARQEEIVDMAESEKERADQDA